MKLFNKTKNIYLTEDLREANSFSDKLLGMIKNSNLGGWSCRTRFGIHTFFLKKPIDVIILDDHGKVVKIASMLPNNLFFWNPKYSHVLELPAGIIKKTKTEVGDILSLRSGETGEAIS
ncbi:MAG: DUF192 domain-containing protein [Candidatus Daviesbacteria bacterium]|nr:DUF192 domain-containing protein [Candidatus Daviesbacteria bacterium]